ncbi:MAG: carboxypeptidase-like regulatory domain-containing protein [Bacteroidota bacterium]
MNRNIKLSIDSPCSENFSEFQQTKTGGFCQSCQKEVIDFTKMTDRELLQFFIDKPTNTCGRFQQSQLKIYSEIIPPKKKWPLNGVAAGLLGVTLATAFPTNNAQAQPSQSSVVQTDPEQEKTKTEQTQSSSAERDHIVNGIVQDSEQTPMIGASVLIKGTTIGTLTDEEGKFSLAELKAGDVLIISYVGFATQEYKIPQQAPAVVNVVLEFEPLILGGVGVLMGEVATNQPFSSKRSFWQRLKGVFQ